MASGNRAKNLAIEQEYLSKTVKESYGSKRVSFSSYVQVSKDFSQHRKNSSVEDLNRFKSLPEFNVAGAAKVYSTANVAIKSPSREDGFSD